MVALSSVQLERCNQLRYPNKPKRDQEDPNASRPMLANGLEQRLLMLRRYDHTHQTGSINSIDDKTSLFSSVGQMI